SVLIRVHPWLKNMKSLPFTTHAAPHLHALSTLIEQGLLQRGDKAADCHKTHLRQKLLELQAAITGTEDADCRPDFLPHDTCPVCSCNVHGRVRTALDWFHQGKIAYGKKELLDLLDLTQP
ncbi:MAG: hypothetical protein KGL39_58035, partial [Patescibacteria group bacterium]|nr:hypothetical protein [Patescibacteria group bacterium]